MYPPRSVARLTAMSTICDFLASNQTPFAGLPQDGPDANEFAQVARRFRVTFVVGSLLSPNNGHRSSLRLSYALEPSVIITGVSRLAEAWQAYERLLDRQTESHVIV